jgi:hypothetical protein
MTDPLHKLLLPSGMVSADFPEHLGELFAMDGVCNSISVYFELTGCLLRTILDAT